VGGHDQARQVPEAHAARVQLSRFAAALLILALPFAAGCGGTKLVKTGSPVQPKAPLRLIADVSDASFFTKKFEEQLSYLGFGILDQAQTRSLLEWLSLEGSSLTDAKSLAELRNRRIDAIMRVVVETTPSHKGDELLNKVRVSVNGTMGGELLASLVWDNSWCASLGSPVDVAMKQPPANAAREIAPALALQLGAPGPKASAVMDDMFESRTAARAAGAPSRAHSAATARQAESDVDSPVSRGTERPNDFAFLIGIEDYQSLPKAEYGARDAQTVRKHLEALGVPARNIISLEGSQATGSKLKNYLQQWLPRNVKPESTVFVYYSGHGAPDPETGDAYLVPWDADPMFLTTSAYPLKQFYAELSKLKAKRVVVALDACFSGSGGRSVLAKGARPLVSKVDESVPNSANLTVLAAASGSEITGTLDDQAHGIFTYYFLKGLSGGAKTPRALYDYLKPRVQDDARRQNREQSPTLAGSGADAAF
jgi:hypothetical protein